MSGHTAGAPAWRRTWSRRPPDLLLALLVLLAAIGYSVFSLVLHARLATGGVDLGIFDQTVWHYSRFEAPASSVKGMDNIWGDHFSPILMLLAPLYWIWEDARMLLIGQAVLLAAAAVPIFLYIRDKLGRLAGYLFALAYLTFWGVQSGVAFQFHELAFAPLLIALTLLSIERRRWVAYFALIVALLAVKENLSILVVAFGVYAMTRGAVRQGLMTIALGALWYVLVVKLLIPHLNPTGSYAYWSYGQFGSGPLSAVGHLVTHPGDVVSTLLGNGTKTHTLIYLLAPFLALMLFSPTAILLVPLFAERFLSSNPVLWERDYHYTLPMAAILVLGTADGLSRLLPRLARGPSRHVLAAGAAGAVLVLNVLFSAQRPQNFGSLARTGFYDKPAWASGAELAIAAVPPAVSVATQDNLVPHLAHRKLIVNISPATGHVDYIVVRIIDSGDPGGTRLNGGFGGISRFVSSQLSSHVPAAYFDGWLVMRSRALPPAARPDSLAPMTAGDAAQIAASHTGWMAAYAQYGRQLANCFAKPSETASCVQGAGSPFRRRQARLRRKLLHVRPSLKAGCRELSSLAALATGQIANALEALRAAGTPSGSAEPARHAVRLQQLQTDDAAGYLTRFVALCSEDRA